MIEELAGFRENVTGVAFAGTIEYVVPAPPCDKGIENSRGVL
jgi:hypothetical protein